MKRVSSLAAFAAVLGIGSAAQAAIIEMTVNPAASSLSVVGGKIEGIDATPQPGGETTSYKGTILLDYDPVARTIKFVTGSSVEANNTPVAQRPNVGGGAGSAPANHGITFVGIDNAALRNYTFDLFSENINLSPTGQADWRPLIYNITGDIDYTGGSDIVPGASDNFAEANPTFVDVGGVRTLTLPMDFFLGWRISSLNDSEFRLVGAIVATSVVPEPATITLIGLGAVGLLARRRA